MTVVAIVGGGVYAPILCESLARSLAGHTLTIRLCARDFERLAVIADEASARVREAHPTASVRAWGALESAVEGADHVVLLVRAGGLSARAHDEAFPREVGLVGDEGIGPGGASNAWRTVPLLTAMALALRARCPTATVWNLIAPLGITTRCLLDAGLDAVGVCELPLVTRERFALAQDALGYAGLNHLGWFWPRTPAALAALQGASEVDAPTLRAFGAAPLRYYYELFASDAAARLGLARAPDRARALGVMADEALAMFRARPGGWSPTRATPWFDRALVPMIAAREGEAPWEGYADVRNTLENRRLCEFAPGDAAVELGVTVDRAGVHTEAPVGAPAPVSRWLAQAAFAEALTYEAARDRDPTALRRALMAAPIPCSRETVEWLASRIERGPEAGGVT